MWYIKVGADSALLFFALNFIPFCENTSATSDVGLASSNNKKVFPGEKRVCDVDVQNIMPNNDIGVAMGYFDFEWVRELRVVLLANEQEPAITFKVPKKCLKSSLFVCPCSEVPGIFLCNLLPIMYGELNLPPVMRYMISIFTTAHMQWRKRTRWFQCEQPVLPLYYAHHTRGIRTAPCINVFYLLSYVTITSFRLNTSVQRSTNSKTVTDRPAWGNVEGSHCHRCYPNREGLPVLC